MTGVHIPYGVYWSTPFSRWQGSLSRLHSLRLLAWTARRELERRGIAPAALQSAVLGCSVPQQGGFYGLPWVTGMLGAPHLAGPWWRRPAPPPCAAWRPPRPNSCSATPRLRWS